jgi:urease accessory protein
MTPTARPGTEDSLVELNLLLQLGDSALPTGAFSHSYGLESYLADGTISGEEELRQWLLVYLHTQLTCTDALAMRWMYEGHSSPAELDGLLDAAVVPVQVRVASHKMGRQLVRIVPELLPSSGMPPGGWPRHYCLVFALAGQAAGIPLLPLLQTYLMSSVTSLVQNAVRAVPLGQLAGQRVLAGLREPVSAGARHALELNEDDFGTTAPGVEIAQMRHEHLRARMFMS